jgi:hypothetical protein
MTSFTISNCGRYLAFSYEKSFFGLCHFPNGYEHDMFMEPEVGTQALDRMFKEGGYVRLKVEKILDDPKSGEIDTEP